MLNTVIIGASGYTGAELAKMVNRHPQLSLSRLYVSKNSVDAGKPLSSLYGELSGIVDLELEGLDPQDIPQLFPNVDVVLLATAHEVSHDIAAALLDCACIVFDLSGAFRVPNTDFYQQFYGFEHRYPELLEEAVYGLAEHNAAQVAQTRLIAVPGCYTTAALTALKPLANANLISDSHKSVINATSGVSGAGRKASMGSSFCEVSLQPYGVFNHRHQPEIVHHLGQDVIFTPHLGSYKRGILATMNVVLKAGTTPEQVQQAYVSAYQDQPIVRLLDGAWPKLQSVVNTPFLDLAWQQQGQDLIVVSAEDNLLKGAASQAMQCINIRFGFDMMESLL
ncbi:N-acetyl-gamma-glutamyl-phosphate reductase [Alginatibacterium sediminis]|uniref:N-acetyl-gamma-glutamyl-phosphate reductase n=1 Tax=Alginatibacterium sediminis TaxID=2164068 RepID=A0A420ELH1_9ALTE|nr:N-acetyl-gamma-glutamyl-phosphate reductase [Alginatibacterium sediminis]RKF21446.1 N-acetyl-gamma-glutamyl-phosphate reductase [Alginatibacterium sediminis]